MKATGIVRRFDDLGRISIPKEIRHNMLIQDGDPMEIFIEDDTLILKKYDFIPTVKRALLGLEDAVMSCEFDSEKKGKIRQCIKELQSLI